MPEYYGDKMVKKKVTLLMSIRTGSFDFLRFFKLPCKHFFKVLENHISHFVTF